MLRHFRASSRCWGETTLRRKTGSGMVVVMESVRELVEELSQWGTELRHDFHRHPELMYCEHWTSNRIQEVLHQHEISYSTGWAKGTGVVARIPATRPGATRTVALRADMDALPIFEENDRANFKGIDIMRTVRSFDPCLPCGVHMYDGGGSILERHHSPAMTGQS